MICLSTHGFSQGTIGVYHGGILTHVGVGLNPEKTYFGEARILAGDFYNNFISVEAVVQRNFSQMEWYNISAGLLLGTLEFEQLNFGFHGMVAIKPLEKNRNLALVLEVSPYFAGSIDDIALRAQVGIRYWFRKS